MEGTKLFRDTKNCCRYPWEEPPAPISGEQIVATANADVVILGGGIAGFSAAVSAKEQGVDVILLEKGRNFSARGGHLGVANSRLMESLGIKADKKALARKWCADCANRVREDLVWLFINESENAMNWLLDKTEQAGIKAYIYDGYYKGPTYTQYPGTHMFDGRMTAVVKLLYENAVKMGADIRFKTPGRQLILDNGRVTGVIAKSEGGYVRFNAAKGVIIATGDLGGNEQMCGAYAPEALETNGNLYAPAGHNTGDGHMMGLWAGGVLQDTPFPLMIHSQYYSRLQFFYLFVNLQGKRFMNEDTWTQPRSLATMKQKEGRYAFSVFDSKWPEEVAASIPTGGGVFWDYSDRTYGTPWTPDANKDLIENYVHGGKIGFRADTLEELAAKMGVPRDNFLATVKRYNEITALGDDADFGKRSELLTSISKPPYYALKFGAALLTVVGGLMTDTNVRVLDDEDKPIPGLYAAGDAAGGIYAVDYPLVLPGNSHGHALTWGYLAGKNCANE